MLGILIFGMLNNNLLRNFGQELGGPECSRSCNCIREACRRCKTLPPPKERRALRSPDRYRPACSRKTTTHDVCYSTDKQDTSKKAILITKLRISILITRANVFFIRPLLDQSSEYRKCGFCVRGVECVWNQMETSSPLRAKRSDEISLGDNNTRRKCFQVCATCTRTVMLLGRGGVVSSPHLHVCPTICN